MSGNLQFGFCLVQSWYFLTHALAFVLASHLHLLSVVRFGTISMRLDAICVYCSVGNLHGIAPIKAMYIRGTA